MAAGDDSTVDADALVRAAWREGLRPDPALSVGGWAEANRQLTSKASARPGPYRLHVTPYAREIGEALSADSGVERLVWMKGSQIGASELCCNVVGYHMDLVPCPMIYVQPTEGLAKVFARQRLQPMIDSTPSLRGKVGEAKSRDATNTTLLKEFPGGMLALIGANSPAMLRALVARVLVLDELDSYPPTLAGEGDPAKLAERATRTFAGQRKIVWVSTPTIKGRSRIERLYEQGDQRRYFVPCPRCGEFQTLYWTDRQTGRRGVQWAGTREALDVWYECAACRGRIEEGEKQAMLEAGQWRAAKPERSATFRSYHLSALYAAKGTYSWRDAVEGFLAAEGKPEEFRVWVNQTLGETWEEHGDAPPWEGLHERCEEWKEGTVPRGGVLLTAGVDVQKDRVEVEVVAWGPSLENWSVGYYRLEGDTGDLSGEVWKKLDELRGRTFPMEDGGRAPVRLTCVDSGYAAQVVYQYARARLGAVLAVKGSDAMQVPVGVPTYVDLSVGGRKVRRGVALWGLGVSILKRELYGWLRAKKPKDGDPVPFGFCHFPARSEEYFKQLTAEQLVPEKDPRGYLRYVWKQNHERNEALDARNYARAAAAILGCDQWNDFQWAKAAAANRTQEPAAAPKPEPNDYWKRWRNS